MVQPNARVYSLAYVSTSQYERTKPNLAQLGRAQNTEISYDFSSQSFEIKGKSQQACDKTAVIICKNLMPLLFRQIQPGNIHGVFCDYKEQLWDKHVLAKAGQAHYEEEYEEADDKSESTVSPEPVSDDNSDFDSDDSDDSLPVGPSLHMGSKATNKAKATKIVKAAIPKPKVHGTFTFAKNVRNPDDVLYGPPLGIMGVAEYLVVVGEDTGTECSLDGRNIQLHGPDKKAVDAAIRRFLSLQSVYKRRRRKPTVVPCMHSFDEQAEIFLYFCPLEQYAKQYFVALPRPLQNKKWSVLILTVKNDNGRYRKPKDLLEGEMPPSTEADDLERRFQQATRMGGTSNAPIQPRLWKNQNPVFNTTSATFTRSNNVPPPTWVTPPQEARTSDFPTLSSPLRQRNPASAWRTKRGTKSKETHASKGL